MLPTLFKGRLVRLTIHGIVNRTMEVKIPLAWLDDQLAPKGIDPLLYEWSLDEAESMYKRFKTKVHAYYEEELKDAQEAYYEDELEYSYLDAVESAGEVPEWVLHVGSYVLEDGLTEEQAELLHSILYHG